MLELPLKELEKTILAFAFPINCEMVSRCNGRDKKGQALNMIPMGMG